MAGNNNEIIKECIRKIISAGNIDKVEIIDCYVSKIYTEEEDDYGTIDVKVSSNDVEIKGVQLSSLEGSTRGVINIPTELSEVSIALVNGVKGHLISTTHIDKTLIDVNKMVSVGVTGLTEDDELDYDELAENGKKTGYVIQEDSFITESSNADTDKKTINSITPEGVNSSVQDNSASESTMVVQSSSEIKLEAENASMSIIKDEAKITSPKIELGNGGTLEKAVLGETLSTVLKAFIDQVSNIITTTSMGPQPILNKAAVIALKGQVDTILSNVNLLE